MTASEMFGVPVKDMPPDVRRRAKAINFGIVYGISAFGLANQLGIAAARRMIISVAISSGSRAFAPTWIAPRPLRARMATSKRCSAAAFMCARSHREYPGMRGGAERQAINAPIQGTAADIIRRAMIRVPPALSRENLDARMLLQVHDELVFEAPESEAAATCEIARQVMERAALPAISLSVPLVVEARAARNWDEAH